MNSIKVYEVISLLVKYKIIIKRQDARGYNKYKETDEYKNKLVKLIVRKKTKPKSFEIFVDKLYSSGVQDLKIVENFNIIENGEFEVDEDENTISVLNRYIEDSEVSFDKEIIKGILQEIYQKACEVEY